MPSVSSPLASKGQLMTKHHAAAVLLVLLSVVLFASSCEARGLRVHGDGRSSSKPQHLPGKDVVATTRSSLKTDGWRTRQTKARSTVDDDTAVVDHMMAQADAKAEAAAIASLSTSGTVGATPPVVRVSQRLSRREDAGFHLDYAGPRTHTPSHN